MQTNAIVEKAILQAENYCARSEKCASDVEQKLYDWGFEPSIYEEVIRYLTEHQFIDSKRYARAFANDKFRFNKWGKHKIKMALAQKKIENSLIMTALSEIPEREYFEIATTILNAKLIELKRKESDLYKIKAKLYNFAASRGFESKIVNNIFSMD